MFRNQLSLMNILRTISGILGCLLGCFRVKDDRRRQPLRISDESCTNNREEEEERLVHESNLSNLFLSDENEGSSFGNATDQSMGIRLRNSEELKTEAKFLKACGALFETPAEIHVYEKVEVSPSCGGDFDPLKFHSQLPNSPVKSLHSEEQPGQFTGIATKHHEALGNESDSTEHTPDSHMTEEQETSGRQGSESEPQISYVATREIHLMDDLSAVTPGLPSISTHKNKSVRFELQLDTEPQSLRSHRSKTAAPNLEQSDSSDSDSGSNKSSYPTPSIITDDMQTPGTIYPSSQKNLASGKRIRSQYVYSILKPIDNLSEWKTLNKEDLNTQQMGYMIQSLEQQENAKPEHTSVSQAIIGGRLQPTMCDMDRPILGIVASHWNFEEPSRVANQLLAWNGIPNSTRKYKEDQKISWHATPFEERLEKALSDEKLISQRKFLTGRPIDFDENEECSSE